VNVVGGQAVAVATPITVLPLRPFPVAVPSIWSPARSPNLRTCAALSGMSFLDLR